MTTAPPDEGRNAFLQPYLGKISSFLRVRGDEDKPISFSFGRRVLALDRWERKAIWQALCADLTVIGDWQVMVAEGAAVLLALIQALERIGGSAPTAARMQALHDLASAMALGDAAMEGLRLRLEAAVAAGQVDLAKGLSGFRIKLLEALAEGHRAADSAREAAGQPPARQATARPASPPVAPPAPVAVAAPPPARAATAPAQDDATAPEDDEAALPMAVEADEPDGAPAEAQAAPAPQVEPAAEPAAEPPPAPSPAETAPADGDLELFLARAAAFLRSRGKEDAAVAIRFGSRTLELPAWERRILWQVLCDGVAPGSAWHDQMAAGAALQLAILAALEELDAKDLSSGARHRIRGELARAVPLATRLADEIRGAIESMVASGRSDEARRLTGFRNRFIVALREGRRATETAGGTTTAPPVEAAGDAKKPTRARLGDAAPERPSVPPPPLELLPYLERATELIRIRGNEERPVTLTVASKSVSFTAWERRVLWQGLCQEGAVVSPWAELLARGAAVQLGALRASETLAQRQLPAEAQDGARAELALLAGLGNTVLTQLSDEITTQSAEGKAELSKRLKAFWEKLAESMQAVRRGLPAPSE